MKIIYTRSYKSLSESVDVHVEFEPRVPKELIISMIPIIVVILKSHLFL